MANKHDESTQDQPVEPESECLVSSSDSPPLDTLFGALDKLERFRSSRARNSSKPSDEDVPGDVDPFYWRLAQEAASTRPGSKVKDWYEFYLEGAT